MTTLEILVAARAKIARPENWCKHHSAETIDFEACFPDSPDAYRWCAQGAIYVSIKSAFPELVFLDVMRAMRAMGYWPLRNFNDYGIHADILRIFDEVIASLQPPPKSTNIDVFTRLLDGAIPAQEPIELA